VIQEYSLVIGQIGFSVRRREAGVCRAFSIRGGPNPFRMRIGRRDRFKTFVGRLLSIRENKENGKIRTVAGGQAANARS
jgi:hypothetical protein